MAKLTSRVTVTTDMLQAADMCAYGICFGDALTTGGSMPKVSKDYHDQKVLSEVQDHALWHAYLNKDKLTSSCVPDPWLKPIRFLRELLIMEPEDRMTAPQALQQPQFTRAITRAQKSRRSEASHGGRCGGGKPEGRMGAR